MARRAEKAATRFRRLKLKLGGADGLDVERVRAVRAVTDLPLQVDVNEWWSLDEALEALPQLAELGVAYCEQPLRAGDEGGRTLKERSPIPIYVDEDCHRLDSVAACAEIAHGINIKLAKSGGIREGIRMAHAARALGLGVMLGCMIESGLGIAAGCAVAPLCDHVDLDGNLLIAEDPWPGVAFTDGVQVPSDRPGARCRASLRSCCSSPRASRATCTTARPPAACSRTANGRSSRCSTRPARGRRRPACRSWRPSNDALCFGPTTAVVGVATQGGRFPPAWRELLKSCIAKGLHLENGLHQFLTDDPELTELAARHGVELRDLRRPPDDLNVPTGANLTIPAQIVLTVGSDCAIGKMTVSLELERAARARGIEARFVPTGQTGIAIAGWGIAVDAVVSDFIAGAAERLVVEGHERGGTLLLVEGQGAVTHPAYSGVTLGLIHGSAPHLFVLCHMAGETEVEGYPGHPLLPLPELVDLHERISLPARRAKVAAVALNTRQLEDDGDARAAIAAAEAETGLVADDPVRFGADRLLDAMLAAL